MILQYSNSILLSFDTLDQYKLSASMINIFIISYI